MKEEQKCHRRTALGLIVAAAMLSPAMGTASGSLSRPDHRFEPALTGSWRVSVTVYNCSTGVENPAFASFLTFGADGTLVETTNNPGFQAGQRSPGHGFWERSGNAYRAVSEAFILFSSAPQPPVPGFQRGSQRIEQEIQLTDRKHFTSEASVSFSDVGGTVLVTGCAKATGERLS